MQQEVKNSVSEITQILNPESLKTTSELQDLIQCLNLVKEHVKKIELNADLKYDKIQDIVQNRQASLKKWAKTADCEYKLTEAVLHQIKHERRQLESLKDNLQKINRDVTQSFMQCRACPLHCFQSIKCSIKPVKSTKGRKATKK